MRPKAATNPLPPLPMAGKKRSTPPPSLPITRSASQTILTSPSQTKHKHKRTCAPRSVAAGGETTAAISASPGPINNAFSLPTNNNICLILSRTCPELFQTRTFQLPLR